jgi:hypothetical protein
MQLITIAASHGIASRVAVLAKSSPKGLDAETGREPVVPNQLREVAPFAHARAGWVLERREQWRDLPRLVGDLGERVGVVVFHEGPIRFCARVMADGVEPSIALAHWADIATGCIDAHRDQPERCLLADVDAVLADAGAFRAALAAHFGVTLDTGAAPPPEPSVPSLFDLIAWYAVSTSQATKDTWGELTGRSWRPEHDPGTELDCTALFHVLSDSLNDQRSRADIVVELLQLREARTVCERDRRLLLYQLQEAHMELEALVDSATTSPNPVEAEQPASPPAILEPPSDPIPALVQPMAEDAEVSRALDRYLSEAKRLKWENRKLTKRLGQAERQLEELRSSTSWRLTWPLRAIVRKLSSK